MLERGQKVRADMMRRTSPLLQKISLTMSSISKALARPIGDDEGSKSKIRVVERWFSTIVGSDGKIPAPSPECIHRYTKVRSSFTNRDSFRRHVGSCKKCYDMGDPHNKKRRTESPSGPEGDSSESWGGPEDDSTEDRDKPSSDPSEVKGQSDAEVAAAISPAANQTVPATINLTTTHQEWDDSDLGMADLFFAWNATNGLQQRWTLLLLNAILVNDDPAQTLEVRVVETYNRQRSHDCFAENVPRLSLPIPLCTSTSRSDCACFPENTG